jgi:hypothetical protein
MRADSKPGVVIVTGVKRVVGRGLMHSHFKRSFLWAIVVLLLLPVASALGARGAPHRKAKPRAGHKRGAVVHRARFHSVASATMVLLGDTAVEWQYDHLSAGQAEAFHFQARTSGMARAVHVYTGASTTAGTLIAGLYSAAAGNPGSLLGSGSSAAPEPGTWTSVSIAPVELHAGTTYWLAILGRGGRLRYRDRASGPCLSKLSAVRTLRALPTDWRTSRTYSDCPVSAYVTAALASPPAAGSPLASTLLEQPEIPGQPVAAATTETVTPPPPSNTVLPSVSGSTVEGQTLSVSKGTWTGSPTSYSYEWEDCNTAGESCSKITGATATTYKLVEGDVGHTLRAVVTASNAGGSTHAISDATATVAPLGAPTNTVPPSVSGSTVEGQALSVSKGTWTGSPTSYTYEWQDCNAAGESCSKITGATSTTYKLVEGDVGHTLRVGVTATNVAGSNEAFSAATGIVLAGSQIDVTQAGAGSQDGEDCANAHSLAWLNTAANWGPGDGKINAGTTVSICGTLTGAIAVAGSGKSGDLITIRFQPGAKISMPACPESGCIDTEEHGYLNIEGTSESEHGVIENTEQETGKKHEKALGIYAMDCEGCTIRYLSIEKLYVKTSEADEALEPGEGRGIEFSGSDMSIVHNTLHDIDWALLSIWNATDGNVRIEYNTIYRIDHGFASASNAEGGSIGPIAFAHNHVYSFKNWDSPGDSYHHDGVHCFTGDGHEAHYNGLYIYDNRFGPETGKNMNSDIFIEGDAEGTPCGDKTSNIWIFNNVAVSGEPVALGGTAVYSTEAHIYNNTIIGPNTTEVDPCFLLEEQAHEVRLKNNILTTCNELIDVESVADLASGGVDYNLYANGGENAFICEGSYEPFAKFSKWQSCIDGDSHSKAPASAKLLASGEEAGKPEAGSPAREAGINLTSLCSGATESLCANINGEPRPSSGAWNIGAY